MTGGPTTGPGATTIGGAAYGASPGQIKRLLPVGSIRGPCHVAQPATIVAQQTSANATSVDRLG